MTHDDIKPVQVAVVPDELPMEQELRRQEEARPDMTVGGNEQTQDNNLQQQVKTPAP